MKENKLPLKNAWVYDIETYKKCFTFVAKKWKKDRTKAKEKWVKFVISDYQNDRSDMIKWLRKVRPTLIGYNNVAFDSQVIEHIYKGKVRTYGKIFEFTQELFKMDKFKLPYSMFSFTFPQVDLMAIKNYGIGTATTTSLKWLEFSMRSPKMKDLPIPFDKETLTEAEVMKVLKYNEVDVDNTERFADKCISSIQMRKSLIKLYRQKWWMNMSDSTIGAQIVLQDYCKIAKKDVKVIKKTFTNLDKIEVKDLILPIVKFKSQELKAVKSDFKSLKLKSEKGAFNLKGKYHKEVEISGLKIDFALGGIHGCLSNTYIESDSEYVICSLDVVSYYPRMAVKNKMAPAHLNTKHYIKAYDGLFGKRKEFPKPHPLNTAFKTSLNSVFGKSNAKRNNFLKDPNYLLTTTINGQLLLTMLAEDLAPLGQLIMMNTDGMEIKIKRKDIPKYDKICKQWEKLTGLELEHEKYKFMFNRDVNNYVSMTESGKVKRKGFFMIYDDYEGQYHKNPSATIIPLAINNFLVNQTPLHETITEHDNVHDFLYGVKGQRNFEYWFLKTAENIVGKVDKRTERALRYYVSKTGSNMFKFWKDGRKNNLQGVSTGNLTTALMNIPRGGKIYNAKTGETYYPNINYDYYIQEAQAVIDQIMQNHV